MAYIPLVKQTKWIDLSNEHKRLREEVERIFVKDVAKKVTSNQ